MTIDNMIVKYHLILRAQGHNSPEVLNEARDPEKLCQWYEKHLGIRREPDGQGVEMHWREDENPQRGMTVWALFEKGTKYFEPSRAPFMTTAASPGS
jgi:hypothetical protein